MKYLHELCWFRVNPAEAWIPDRGSGRRTGQTHGSAPTNAMTFGDDPCPAVMAEG